MKDSNREKVYTKDDFINVRGRWFLKTGFVFAYTIDDEETKYYYLDEILDVVTNMHYVLSKKGVRHIGNPVNLYWTGNLKRIKRGRHKKIPATWKYLYE